MTISDDNYQPLGETGGRVPPVVFRGDFLANADRLIPEQTLRVICADWFQQVPSPVHIALPLDSTLGACLEFLTTTIRRHEVDPHSVQLNFQLRSGAANAPSETLQKQLEWGYLSGATSLRPLVTRDIAIAGENTKGLWTQLADLRESGRVAGFGLRTTDWRLAEKCADLAKPDYFELVGAYTILRHPPELHDFLARLRERQITVIAAGVFHSGYLVGGPRFDDRVLDPDDSTDKGLIAWRKAFTSLCHGHGIRPAHACIQFALQAPAIAAVSLSTTQPQRVTEALHAATQPVPEVFWESMREEGLLGEGFDFPAR